MGSSSKATLCFGFVIKKGMEFPWEEEGFQEWWYKISGNYSCPISEIQYNYDNGYILCVTESIIYSWDDLPESVDIEKINNIIKYNEILIEFCKKYGITIVSPEWLLSVNRG